MIKISKTKKQKIINRSVNYIVRDGMDAALAVTDSIAEICTNSTNDKGVLLVSAVVVNKIKEEVILIVQKRVKSKTTRECLCGCGNTTNPGRNFIQGHDSRLVKKVVQKTISNDLYIVILPEALTYIESKEGTKIKNKIEFQVRAASIE